MRSLLAPIVWIYDFLAEDLIILVGSALAIALTALLVHVAPKTAGYVFIAAVILAILASIWRTVSAR